MVGVRFRVSAPAFVAALTAIATVGLASASQYVETSRPLTRSEMVSTTVHEAERIVVGDLVSYRLTDEDRAAGRAGYLPYHLGFRPRRWLKGDEGSAEFTVCWWPGPEEEPRIEPPSGMAFVLFAIRPDTRSYVADSCNWFGIHEGPAWLLPSFSPWSLGFEDDVRRTIANQEPEALVLHSDRVVLGTVEREARGGSPGRPVRPPATFVRVRRAFKGPRAPERLPVRLVDERAVALNDNRPHLFYLRRTDDGIHEPVELIAGVIPAFGKRVTGWDMSVDDALRRIERAVAAGKEAHRKARAARSK